MRRYASDYDYFVYDREYSGRPLRQGWYPRNVPDGDFRGPSFGYRGPGTDLGEDIRRSYVGRSGYRGPRGQTYPPDHPWFHRPAGSWRYDAPYRDWTGPLRNGWQGLRRGPGPGRY